MQRILTERSAVLKSSNTAHPRPPASQVMRYEVRRRSMNAKRRMASDSGRLESHTRQECSLIAVTSSGSGAGMDWGTTLLELTACMDKCQHRNQSEIRDLTSRQVSVGDLTAGDI